MSTQLANLHNAAEVLERTPSGTDLARVAARLGLINADSLRMQTQRRAFVAEIAALSPAQLSDEQSYWASEFGRITELAGILRGQNELLAVEAKAARARARARVRRAADSGARLSVAQVDDEAASDPTVRDVEERRALVSQLLAAADAAREATGIYLQAISREITFRTAQMNARVY